MFTEKNYQVAHTDANALLNKRENIQSSVSSFVKRTLYWRK